MCSLTIEGVLLPYMCVIYMTSHAYHVTWIYGFVKSFELDLFHTHTHTPVHSLSHTHTHSLSLSLKYVTILGTELLGTVKALNLFHTHTQAHTNTHIHSLCLWICYHQSFFGTVKSFELVSCTRTNTHTHTHSLSLSLSEYVTIRAFLALLNALNFFGSDFAR